MLGKSRKERMKENAASASALALELAQDKRFRTRLLSAIEHGSEAGRRTRRGLGLGGAVGRLATDKTLLRELRSARSDLQQAYGQLEAKRRTHKLRNVLLLAALGSLAGVPQLRARLGPRLKRLRSIVSACQESIVSACQESATLVRAPRPTSPKHLRTGSRICPRRSCTRAPRRPTFQDGQR